MSDRNESTGPHERSAGNALDGAASGPSSGPPPPDWLALVHDRGRAAWPDFDLDGGEVAAGFAVCAASDAADADQLDAAELYLACGCRCGVPSALAHFQARYLAPLDASLAQMGLDAAARADLWQALAARLFVAAPGAPARIVTYAGRGQLHGLVKVAATRLALDQLERRRRDVSDTWLDRMPGAASDPELHWIKHQHRAELKQEVEGAIGELSPRQRALLRLAVVERLSLDAIAVSYQTHRSTVARWLARARDELARRVRARLIERWRISDAELAEVRPLVDSQLQLSLERLLSAG